MRPDVPRMEVPRMELPRTPRARCRGCGRSMKITQLQRGLCQNCRLEEEAAGRRPGGEPGGEDRGAGGDLGGQQHDDGVGAGGRPAEGGERR